VHTHIHISLLWPLPTRIACQDTETLRLKPCCTHLSCISHMTCESGIVRVTVFSSSVTVCLSQASASVSVLSVSVCLSQVRLCVCVSLSCVTVWQTLEWYHTYDMWIRQWGMSRANDYRANVYRDNDYRDNEQRNHVNKAMRHVESESLPMAVLQADVAHVMQRFWGRIHTCITSKCDI